VCIYGIINDMRKEMLAPTLMLGLGLSLAACSSNEGTPQEVTGAAQNMSDEYGCNGTPKIFIEDISSVSGQTFGNTSTGLAYTDKEGIHLSNKESIRSMASLVTHETLHWCADRETSKTYTPAYRVTNNMEVTGSTGFVPIINGEAKESGPTHVEEGVVEWVSRQESGYQSHAEYDQLADITSEIAKLRDFDTKDVVDLLKNDDLVGYVALVVDKRVGEVTGEDIFKVVQTYIDSYDNKNVPNVHQLSKIFS
jgi:hypothetical protein